MLFNNLLENIKSCKGGIINLIYDDRTICNEFLMCITNELNYNIIDPKDEIGTRFSKIEDLKKMLNNIVDGKNIIFINQGETKGQTNYGEYLRLIDNDTILVILSNYYITTNTQLSPLELQYTSSLTLLLRNKKIKIMKSRNEYLDDHMKTLDIKQILRKSKLKTLSGK